MKTLLFGADPTQAMSLAAALKGDGHELVMAADDKAGRSALGDQGVNIVLVAPGKSDPELVLSFIREARKSADRYIGVLAQQANEEFLVRAYEAGIDADFGPSGQALIAARMRAAERLLGAVTARKAGKAKLEKGPSAGALITQAQESPIDIVARSQAWIASPTTIQVAASTFLTLPASMEEIPPDVGTFAHACQIILSNVQHQLELRVAIGLDAASAKNLSVHMFGPEGEDLASDMLGEVANIFMGVLKTSFAGDELAFTGGLPEPIGIDLVLRPNITFKRQEAFTLIVGDAKIHVHLGIRSKGNLFVALSALKEGMVVAKDIFNGRGVLLVNSGTRLSANMIKKLEDILLPKSLVEVMAP